MSRSIAYASFLFLALAGSCRTLHLQATSEAARVPPAQAPTLPPGPSGPAPEGGVSTEPAAASAPFELWFSLFNTFRGDAASVRESKAVIDRAAASGYTGMLLLISGPMARASAPDSPIQPSYWSYLRELLEHATTNGIEVVPAIFPMGRSGGILDADPYLAEGSPVKNALMQVSPDGTHAELVPRLSGLTNGDFEQINFDSSGQDFRCFDGWTCWDRPGRMTLADDTHVRPGSAGQVSARLQRHTESTVHARLRQIFSVEPWTLYKVSYWGRAEALVNGVPVSGKPAQPNAVIHGWDRDRNRRRRLRGNRTPPPSETWTRYQTIVNSGDDSFIEIILSIGIAAQGTAWFDDLEIEEVAFVNLVRGTGGPLWARSLDGSVTYVEGTDFEPLVDPIVAEGPPGRRRGAFELYHEPPVLTIRPTSGSRLVPDQEFLIDYYAVVPLDHGSYTQVGATVCGPEIGSWMRENLAVVDPQLPSISGYLLAHGEIRQMNTSANCEAMGLSAGEVLAQHMESALGIVHEVRPDAELYVWNDMFDPFHNARPDYHQVQGDLAGSWEGLSPDVIILNWGMTRRHPDRTPADLIDSIRWFAGQGQRQILAGYYGLGDGAAAANRWLNKAAESGAPGIIGLMYTAWSGTPEKMFRELETFAEAAWDHPFVMDGAQPPLDTTPPSVPTDPEATAVSPFEVELSWAPSSDDVAVAGYRVYRNGVEIASTATPWYTDRGLAPHARYTYTVTAHDAFQNVSEPSDTVAAITPPVLGTSGWILRGRAALSSSPSPRPR